MSINTIDKLSTAHMVQVVVLIMFLIITIICLVIEIKKAFPWISEILNEEDEEDEWGFKETRGYFCFE